MGLLLELHCVIVIKQVAFLTICAKLLVTIALAFTCPGVIVVSDWNKYTVNLRRTARGAYFKFRRRRQGRLFKGVAYLVFPKSWPDITTFLIHHLPIMTSISCLLT